ncbi:GNAT family N-acetyltransferase [Oceanirhabdus sp. W0125-5]|uniref:GNAT family N-acetyltransferase n=1 Tax=Oceanirhabdus sp. W0125-5 TaxID=2999116 RepID=UPI0022F2E739|nr:GNAT family N-acetyltransferase [Oceanirhabdus sp. W0125-5]WBW96951.1 GNAT family N-acetyltransferase [Oceanirhabdus sp. W0125-5]
MKITSFQDALISEYIKDPVGVQATALWKTFNGLDNFQYKYSTNNENVSLLKIWNDNMLHTLWSDGSKSIKISDDEIKQYKMMILKGNQFNDGMKAVWTNVEPYFKLAHNHEQIQESEVPDGFYIKNVDIKCELEQVSELICKCYEHIKPDTNEVKRWTQHEVFNKNLWIWVIDKNTEKPAALGIADVDTTIREGALEWIQVLPEYQGKKLGKTLVLELLNRLKDIADFTTVSGEVDNKTNPERLYRRCGFEGEDIWYVLRR